MTPILEIEQYGFSYLAHCNRKEISRLAFLCVRMGLFLAMLGAALTWCEGGFALIADRLSRLPGVFGAGAFMRLLYAAAWEKTTVSAEGVWLTNGVPLWSRKNDEVHHISVKIASRQRVFLRLTWVDKKHRPAVAFGRVESPEDAITELKRFYVVTDER